eukprot:7379186-Prymnesium_polylepis.1
MEFAFPALSTSVLLTTCAVLVCYGDRLSFDLRIATTTLLMAAGILVVPCVDLLINVGAISTDTGFLLTMVAVCINAMCSASAQNALYALASLLGDTSTQALQTGNGLIGLLAVLLRVATMIGLEPQVSVWIFSLLASASLLLSLAGYTAVTSDSTIAPLLRAHEQRRAQRKVDAGALQQPMLDGGESGGGEGGGGGGATLAAARLVWREAACVFLVFLVCLTCFPGLTTSISSTSWGLGSWYPLLLVASYNAADLLGKSLPAKVRLFGPAALPCCVLVHGSFVPFFLLLVQARGPAPPAPRASSTALLPHR